MSLELEKLAAELKEIKAQNAAQTALLMRMDMAITGDPARGLVGLVELQKALAARVSSAEESIMVLQRERWFARLGQSAVAGAVGAAGVWLKVRFFGE